MAEDAAKPDFRNGFPIDQIPDGGSVPGRVDADEAILVRRGDQLFAVGAHCTHYQGSLAEGLVVGDTVRCPLHHACFSLRSGEALRAPAIDPIPCWRVERVGNKAFAREKLSEPRADSTGSAKDLPASVVIVGGGAAGFAAADMLRRKGYQGPVTMLSADDSPPVDRPNLSKDFLEGNAQDDWIPLRAPDYYAERRIELVLDTRVSAIDLKLKRVQATNGKSYDFGALLIATGADPVRPETPTSGDAAILYLRTFADARAIVAKAESARSVVVVGAGFIGLEVAASIRIRGLAVHVVAPDKVPLERVVGADVGQVVRAVHEEHGVVFHLGRTVSRVDGKQVTLSDGSMLTADFVVMGVGVRPAIALAEQAGLALDRGIAVDEYLRTSAPGVYAAGDVARWPDPHSGERVRIEHWVVAERQGQVAAQNILGHRIRFDAVPFFWSKHYDFVLHYVGHAEKWDAVEIDGSLAARDCTVTYTRDGLRLAVVTIDRDLQSLQAELAMEQYVLSLRQTRQGDQMSSRFDGKVVVVAGGTGGLGRAVSLGFLEEGARVVVTYRKQEEFISLKNTANANASRLEGQAVDVTDEVAVSRVIDGVVAQHEQLDALVNAAGGYAGGVNLWEAESKVLEQMLALNLRSGYALARAAVRAMLKQGHGSIVNVAAKAAFDHFPGAGAYVASKAAAVAMLDSLAAEVKGSGVRVNSVLPSIIDTEANRKAMPAANFAKWPKPVDIARVILFLCSDDAKVIHGASIPVYGDS